MSNRLIQYGFTSGIVSRELWSQTILQKYGYGLADSRNFICKFGGSIITRGASIFGTVIQEVFDPLVFAPFIFSHDDAGTFALLFSPNKLRFLQQGVYVLEAAKNATSITAGVNDSQIGIVGHGYAVGDLVELFGANIPEHLRGQTIEVVNVANANVFGVRRIAKTGNIANFTTVAAFQVRRVYTISTPFTAELLAKLYITQARDVLRLTTGDLPPQNLTRNNDGTWTLSPVNNAIAQASPTNLRERARSGTGQAGTVFVVTAVNKNGEESLPSNYLVIKDIDDYSTTAGWFAIKWDAVPGAVRYNIYRSIILANSSTLSIAIELGYLATAYAPRFTDKNYIPDFTKVPPQAINPFVNSAIERIDIVTPGTAYATTNTISITDATGTGADVVPIVDNTEVIGVLIINGGKNYTAPTITMVSGTGSGATFSTELTPSSGNYPKTSGLHNQRQIYANIPNNPLRFFGSQIGLFDNFNYSRVISPDESYTYEISSAILGEIKHLVSVRSGLLVFTNLGVWVVTGSQGTITATDIEADLQTAVGCANLQPLLIDADILYAELRTQTVRLLQYNDFSKNFGGTDVSVLARDLFRAPYAHTQWAYEPRPFKLVWSVRSDGRLISGTLAQEQQVYAWNVHETAGLYQHVISLPETKRDTTYTVTQRELDGRFIRTIEYFAPREMSTNFEHVGVDAAVPFGFNFPNAFLAMTGNTITASAAIFAPTDVGKVFVHRNGKGVITSYVSSTELNFSVIDAFTHLEIPYSQALQLIPPGEWVFAKLTNKIQLPLNMRAPSLTVVADGKIFENQVHDENGIITLPEETAFGYVGFGFQCEATTLPFRADGTIIEDSRINVKGVGLRYVQSKGIELAAFDEDYAADTDFYPIEDYFSDFMAESTRLRSSHDNVILSSDWNVSTLIKVRVHSGNPAEITGMVFNIEAGDDVS